MIFALPALLGLLLQAANPAAPTASEQYFRYHRTIVPVSGRGEACTVIEPGIFPKAAPSLKDLRLYQDGREIPFAITLSQPEQPDSDSARVLNLGMLGDTIVFDLEMPARRYTDVALDLAAKNYLATAVVSGMSQPGAIPTSLGEFTLFDLSEQHLSHNTTLHLQESSFPFLHVAITASPAPGSHDFVISPQIIVAATVPPQPRGAGHLYHRTLHHRHPAARQPDHRRRNTAAPASHRTRHLRSRALVHRQLQPRRLHQRETHRRVNHTRGS